MACFAFITRLLMACTSCPSSAETGATSDATFSTSQQLRASQREFRSLPHRLRHHQRLLDWSSAARKREKLGGKTLRTQARLLRLFEEVAHGATARPLDTGKRNVRQDASQDVVEIVRDAAREQTQALELLMAQALIGDLALERNVTQHEDCAAPSLDRALQRRGLHRDQP